MKTFFIIFWVLRAVTGHREMSLGCENSLTQHFASLKSLNLDVPEATTTWNVSKDSGGKSMEGGTNYNEFVEEVILAHRACGFGVKCNRICQTGFNAGTSAIAFLCATSSHIEVHSFDLGSHDYVAKASAVIDKSYPGRHKLTLGSSTETLPKLITSLDKDAEGYCDFAFVDGGHSYDIANADIANFVKLSKKSTYIIVENCNSWGKENGWGGMAAVNNAYINAVKIGLIEHVRQISVGPCGQKHVAKTEVRYCREICVARKL